VSECRLRGLNREGPFTGTLRYAETTIENVTYPSRIVCLTEETTETLYLLGEGHRVVGISGYTMRPPEARQKPKISAFINARFDKIVALEPDLVLAFSDLQADLAAELIRRGIAVFTFNQRSVAEILQMIRVLGGIVGCGSRAEALAAQLDAGLQDISRSAQRFPDHPRVFFEEWDSPLISGITWVDELIEIAGGRPVFPALRSCRLASDRIVDPAEVAARCPDVILASWCGKSVKKRTIAERTGWAAIPAVRNDHIYEIKSTYILQPGPAALTDGVRQVHAILCRVAGAESDPPVAPREGVAVTAKPA
jgi:iron complex transport system substrate-binding protein